MNLILCEKPSQAKDIAAVLGNSKINDGYIESGKYTVTWAFGHLMEQLYPGDYKDDWKSWNLNSIPMIPDVFKISPKKTSLKQFKIIKKLLSEASLVIIGTDADREGEMIAREIMEYCKYKGPVKRLWLSALDPESINKGFQYLKDGKETESLYYSARSRSRADWLVGINLTRAFTLQCANKNETFNIGRVQTPTFSLVVKRDREITNFKPQTYYAINAKFAADSGVVNLQCDPKDEFRIFDISKADKIADSIRGEKKNIAVTVERKKKAPPSLFSLSGFQKKANSLFGWDAEKSLNICQSLYEKHKATTYPRTDCVFLPEEQIPDVKIIADNLCSVFNLDLDHSFDDPVIRSTVFNSKKVTAHHAIIPTKKKFSLDSMSEDEKKAFQLISFHYLASFMFDYEFEKTTLKIEHSFNSESYLFETQGTVPVFPGWRKLLKTEEKEPSDNIILPSFVNGESGIIKSCDPVGKKTKAPSKYTEGTLLADMESVGKYVQDPKLKKLLKDTSGLGTEATRAGILSKLKKDNFLQTKGKYILSTEKSNRFYDIIAEYLPDIIDPALTAIWEESLESIAAGSSLYFDFEKEIVKLIHSYCLKVLSVEQNEQRIVVESVKKKTVYFSPHKDHSDEPVLEDENCWYVPGYGKIFKTVSGRKFQFNEIKDILLKSSTTLFDFTGSKGPFKARLVFSGIDNKYKSVKFKFDFPTKSLDPHAKSDLKSIKYGSLYEFDDYYTFDKMKSRIFKNIYGRVFSSQEIVEIVDSKDGVSHCFKSKKKGTDYEAKVYFNAKSKPFPKMELKFS